MYGVRLTLIKKVELIEQLLYLILVDIELVVASLEETVRVVPRFGEGQLRLVS